MTMKHSILENQRHIYCGNVTVAKHPTMTIQGDIPMVIDRTTLGRTIAMENVLNVLDLCTNSVSAFQMLQNGNEVVFSDEKFVISDRFGMVIATATLVDDMFKLNCNLAAMVRNDCATSVREETSLAARMNPSTIGKRRHRQINQFTRQKSIISYLWRILKCGKYFIHRFSSPSGTLRGWKCMN